MLGVIEYDFFQYIVNEMGLVNQFIMNIMQFVKVVDDIFKGGCNLEIYVQFYQVFWQCFLKKIYCIDGRVGF